MLYLHSVNSYTHKHFQDSIIHSQSQRLYQVQSTQQPPTNMHPHTQYTLDTDFAQGVVTFNNTQAGSSYLLQPANYDTGFNDEGSIEEVTCCPLCSQLLSGQTLFFPACQCQEPIKEQWWGYNMGKQCKDGPRHCSPASLLEKCPVVVLHFSG